MSEETENTGWWTPTKVGFGLTALVLFGFACMAAQRNCVLLPSEVLECRTNWAWFLSSPPNEVGDTLAGFAGSLAFIWIVVTVAIQSKELSEQREQLRLQTDEFKMTNDALAAQRFDQAFFGLISTYSEIVDNIESVSHSREVKGRLCFVHFTGDLKYEFTYSRTLEKGPMTREDICLVYDKFWNEHNVVLGHYFRFLYNAFRFISENPTHAKPHHARLLRSQLSDQELQLLFYNCLSNQGQKFIDLAKEFQIFDNLPRKLLFQKENASLVPAESWGKNVGEGSA